MHISEGVLKAEIIVPCAVITAVWLSFLLYKLKAEQIPRVACFSAIFFVASFIHLPIGPTSIHLILSGLVGAFLGAQAFTAIFIGLLLQAVFFGYGGVSVLGVNSLVIAVPALLGAYILRLKLNQAIKFFLVGFVPILVSSMLLSLVLAANGREFFAVATFAFGANIALMVLEGIISLFSLKFISRVKKDLLPC